MNISKISPDDPKLTAYALGELDGAERAAIEAAIQNDPAAQAAVEQIRALGGELSAALAQEPLPAVTPLPTSPETVTPEPERGPKIVRFPYFLVAGLAAACFAVLFVREQRAPATKPEMQLAEAKTKGATEPAGPERQSRVYQFDLKKEVEEARVTAMPATRDNALSDVASAPADTSASIAGGEQVATALTREDNMLSGTLTLPEVTVSEERMGSAGAISLVPNIKKFAKFPDRTAGYSSGKVARKPRHRQ